MSVAELGDGFDFYVACLTFSCMRQEVIAEPWPVSPVHYAPTEVAEFLTDYAKPFSLLVIADLLGVPMEDHEEFKAVFASETVGELGKETPTSHNPLQWLNDKFYSYIEDRRLEPRDDVLTELAQAKHEDGSTPEIEDVMNLSTFLFAAGTETTTKLVSSAVRIIGDNPKFEDILREDRSKIPAFLEETLRFGARLALESFQKV